MGFACAPILDMAAAAHFLSQVGLLFEVRWDVRGFRNAQILPGFGEETLSNRKQKSEPNHWRWLGQRDRLILPAEFVIFRSIA